MSESAAHTATFGYHPTFGHSPRSRRDRNKRLHRYVSALGAAADAHLKQALLVLRTNSGGLPGAELQAAAQKQYLESEFLPATKVLLCLWIYLEALDQGGESMPSWLMEFLKLALRSTDFLIAQPQVTQVMEAQCECRQVDQLVKGGCEMIGFYLGYGDSTTKLSPAFAALLESSRGLRQQILRDALTEDAAAL